MKTLLILLTLVVAPTVYADISDSGNLSLGGLAVVTGTMTIQGNGFSVGGSSLAVNNGNIGIRTSSPAVTLDVNGASQFGQGATKSTFSATGFLTIVGSTFSTASTGMISGPSQPFVRATGVSTNLPSNTWVPSFFTTPAAGENNQNMWGGASSSGTFTVPTGGAGFYLITCSRTLNMNLAGYWGVAIYKNGSPIARNLIYETTVTTPDRTVTTTQKLAAGDAITCWNLHNSAGIETNNSGYQDRFEMLKVW